jgi:hypothetical protein
MAGGWQREAVTNAHRAKRSTKMQMRQNFGLKKVGNKVRGRKE